MREETPRSERMIQGVVDTIWADGQRVKCPICSDPMEQAKPYKWVCGVDRCPIEDLEFNEVIHSYGTRSKPKWKK